MAETEQFTRGDVLYFCGDTTARWSCRENDVVALMRLPGLFAQSWDMVDFWQCWDGDFVTLTNRVEDLPSWFELHPTEMRGRNMGLLERGKSYAEPAEAPNLWRVSAGDRVLWVGEERPFQPAVGGVLAIVEFKEDALLVRDTNRDVDFMEWAAGQPREEPIPNMELVRRAVKIAQGLGEPRNLSAGGWGLG